jgi:hypothetical protein
MHGVRADVSMPVTDAVHAKADVVCVLCQEALLNADHGRKRRKLWIHNAWKRKGTGEISVLFYDVIGDDMTEISEKLQNVVRTAPLIFGHKQTPVIQNISFRKAVGAREKLAVCLR